MAAAGAARTATIETAGAAGLEEMPVRGPWTVTVPGAIRSWGDAHARFGRLAWADLFAPAIDLADGFPATDGWVLSIERSARIFGDQGDWAKTFRPLGRSWRTGEVVRLPNLASTLRTIAKEGPDASYSGSLAAQACAYLGSSGSPLRPADFAAHTSTLDRPDLHRLPRFHLGQPPTQRRRSDGPRDAGHTSPLRPARGRRRPDLDPSTDWRRRALAIADRDEFLTDPEHMSDDDLEIMLDPDRLAKLAADIDPRHTAATPDVAMVAGDTVFLATGDGEGNLVSLIESNWMGFGSGLVDPATGISYHNRGSLFRLDPDHVNALAPSKRTFHTLTPGMLLRDGNPWIAHGSMGGEIQPQVFAQFVSAVVDSGMDLAAGAGPVPRWLAEPIGFYGPPSISLLESRLREFTRRRADSARARVEWAADIRLRAPATPTPSSWCRHRGRRRPRSRRRLIHARKGRLWRGEFGLVYSGSAGRAALTTRAAGHPFCGRPALAWCREFERSPELPVQQRDGS